MFQMPVQGVRGVTHFQKFPAMCLPPDSSYLPTATSSTHPSYSSSKSLSISSTSFSSSFPTRTQTREYPDLKLCFLAFLLQRKGRISRARQAAGLVPHGASDKWCRETKNIRKKIHNTRAHGRDARNRMTKIHRSRACLKFSFVHCAKTLSTM